MFVIKQHKTCSPSFLINIIIFYIFFSTCTSFEPLCPSLGDINPCECISNSIRCHNIGHDFDLESISKKVQLKRSNASFAEFSLYNTSIKKIGNIFKSVAFKHISIKDNKNLSDISGEAFSGSGASLPILDIEGNVKLSNTPPHQKNIFHIATQFVNVRYILFPHNRLISIPTHAFNSNNSDLHELTYLNLRENNITKIESQTFVDLTKLSSINLGQNKIDSIAKSAFVLSANISSGLVFIDYNRLNSSSFERNWFSLKELKSSAKIDIDLSNNNITYLDQSVFEELLNPKYNVVLTVRYNPFKCDCRSRWLVRNKKLFQSKVRWMTCEDKKDIWQKNYQHFNNCSSK